MSTIPPPSAGFAGWLTANRPLGGKLLAVTGVALIGLAIYLGVAYKLEQLAITVWAGLIGIATLAAGLWLAAATSPEERIDSDVRHLVLGLSGLIGALTFLYGLVLLVGSYDLAAKILREGEREGAWKFFVAVAVVLAGLATMFLGLQTVRADERKVAGLRRAMYGFNAFLNAFLLLAILIVINAVIAFKVPATIDATRSGSYSLAERTKTVLGELQEPTKVYFIAPPNRSDVSFEVTNLIARCQEVSPKITTTTVSPADEETFLKLAKKFPRIGESEGGLLVVYGEEKPENSGFIPMGDLRTSDRDPMSRGGGDSKVKFQGEVKLVNELSLLMSGSDKPVVHFTQGFGEPALDDQQRRGGLGILGERLRRRNFEPKPLTIEALAPKIPDDVKMLVVAGPRQLYPPGTDEAVRGFLARGGKMIFLADVVEGSKTAKEMIPTGFEAALADYGVELTRDRLFMAPIRNAGGGVSSPAQILGTIDAGASSNPIAAPFKRESFFFVSCRAIKSLPMQQRDPKLPMVRATTLVSTPTQVPVWIETDLQADPRQTLNLMMTDPAEREKRFAKGAQPLAIVVSEEGRAAPGGPPPVEKSKLAVFANTSFATNVVTQSADSIEFDLFIGVLEWLREKPANIGIDPRSLQYYHFNPEVVTNNFQVHFLALMVLVFVIAGLGTGVWLTRRR